VPGCAFNSAWYTIGVERKVSWASIRMSGVKAVQGSSGSPQAHGYNRGRTLADDLDRALADTSQ
jgi:hypothetical protein